MNKILSRLVFVLVLFPLSGCDYFSAAEERTIIVRVNDSYLFEEDIQALIDENTSPEDSALIVSNYINRWATQQLLIDRALLNLPQKQQDEFDDLVENYRNEIYTNAYTEAIVSKKLDTSFNEEEIEAYYEQNKENFKLNEDLVKLRYINLDKNNTNLDKIKTGIIRFNDEDKTDLESLALQFKNYSMNDSIWVRTKAVYDKIGPLSVEDRSQLLKKSNYLQVEDSLSVYLIYVNDVLTRNEQAPLEYASATIEQILLNKRKQDLVKELEKDITKDAIKNNEFEIFN
ncbi:peptidyl-prolyl cis-trans isomerase [Salegentibacter sp. F188]|uniref:Peptidyl-prolyl cis-trans isomerase n=1 Tax=Autumnicola patrickiae TaxID=3075591 RepID=A0ABU3E6D5_9FLAO|nr:peptidyl-prolyl cis-trans isomerase [Salegentibacter sp. F188]MDT0691556.1 peptidyl-prolyl cis-trans isomerase [Salegentibacter sp. F188]